MRRINQQAMTALHFRQVVPAYYPVNLRVDLDQVINHVDGDKDVV